MFVISDNYFRSISGLSSTPYPENQPSPECPGAKYLSRVSQVTCNTGSKFYSKGMLEQLEMYNDGNASLHYLSPPVYSSHNWYSGWINL